MNIFVLDKDPAIAASYHCDQHLHKMILEAAQMLSTAAYHWFPSMRGYIYKPAYEKHPCTRWVKKSYSNAFWLSQLALELDNIRQTHGAIEHKSMPIIKAIVDNLLTIDCCVSPTGFVFVGDVSISIRHDLDVITKYRKYYQLKHHQWVLDKGAGMTYKVRSIPEFMKGLVS